MAQEIKFRGRRKDNGEWAYGSVYYSDYGGIKETWIIEHNETVWFSHSDDENLAGVVQECFHRVDSSTVAQFTGQETRNEQEVWEGDVMQFAEFDYNGSDILHIGTVIYRGSKFMIKVNDELLFDLDWALLQDDEAKVYGSIHDNLELITP